MSELTKAGIIYALAAIVSLTIIGVAKLFFPHLIPFELMSLWNTTGSVGDWFVAGLPIFAWGIGVNIVHLIRIDSGSPNNPAMLRRMLPTGMSVWIEEIKTSLFAGVIEEIYFRWFYFLSAIVVVSFFNLCFFGWLGFGVPEWFFLHLGGPLADWTTFHYLHDHIFDARGWAIGSAMLLSNAGFRNGHKYQGFFGYVNSWFMGMFFFWILFQYGLPAAILLHFIYDFLIGTVAAIYIAAKRA